MKALELPELDILAHYIQGASSGSTWSKDHPGWISTDYLVLGKQHVDFRSLDPACLSPTLPYTLVTGQCHFLRNLITDQHFLKF